MEFRQWLEAKSQPCGQCFPWAIGQIIKNDNATLAHGMVKQPFSNDPYYWHAWIEDDGIAKDWQTMESGFGGKFMGKGFPIDDFYELFKPKGVRKYTFEEALAELARSRSSEHPYGHSGPWD